MPGVGKSQTAAAYIEEHGDEYPAVFWLRGTTPEEFTAQMASLAPELAPHLPPNAAQDAQLRAVKQWFADKDNWLLVVDNAVNLPELRPLLPQNPTGRVLLTTWDAVPADFADAIEITHLDEATGALLLLRRAEILSPKRELQAADGAIQADAKAVSATLGGLALALDQAGAYMQTRSITPAVYQSHYEQRRQKLHHNYANPDHRSVAVTFSLALEQVEQSGEFGPAAAELARMCAFLAPDPIPDAVFQAGASVLNEPLAALAANEIDYFDVCEAACRGGLLSRTTNPSGLWMHRLAQEVLRDTLNPEQQKMNGATGRFRRQPSVSVCGLR